MIKVLFFGITRDFAGTAEKMYPMMADLKALAIVLENDYPELKTAKYRFALNGVIRGTEAVLNENDIVALLPPFAGG